MLKKIIRFIVQKRIRPKITNDEERCTSILAAVAHNPHTSIRQIARGAGIGQRTVTRILHSKSFHSYHLSVHQELHRRHFEKRKQFCEWFLRQMQNTNGTFVHNVLFTDEATFTNHNEINIHLGN